MKIVLIGDTCIDTVARCDVTRISPEAPVPVAKCVSRKRYFGGLGRLGAYLEHLHIPVSTICLHQVNLSREYIFGNGQLLARVDDDSKGKYKLFTGLLNGDFARQLDGALVILFQLEPLRADGRDVFYEGGLHRASKLLVVEEWENEVLAYDHLPENRFRHLALPLSPAEIGVVELAQLLGWLPKTEVPSLKDNLLAALQLVEVPVEVK